MNINKLITFIVRKYYELKLWYWWFYTIEENEFHNSLNHLHLYMSKKMTPEETTKVVTARRNITHNLDSGMQIKDMPTILIKKAQL